MQASLVEQQKLNDLASFLYDFLPGEPHPFADETISFRGVSRSLGMPGFWQGGSKLPAISKLLTNTFEQRQGTFCPLILEVVKRGMGYRQKKGTPITRDQILRLNDILKGLSFKIPDLYDPKFLDSLPRAKREEGITLSAQTRKGLADELIKLSGLAPQPRGYAFEGFLRSLFEAHNLAPKDAFRVVGEQIDGSFQSQAETYLLEATWRATQLGQEELLSFAGKVAGKATWSRGLLISYAGFTKDGLAAFARGKPTQIVCMDGLDLHETLRRNLELRLVLERKVRRAAETNDAHVSVLELFP
jgi:hypothetical protein